MVTSLKPRDTLGRQLHDLRISVTDRCNFRCPYCMPAEVYGARYKFLPRNELLTFEEIARLARIFVKMGVRKLRLTGGEPTIRADVARLVAMLAGLRDPSAGPERALDLTMTTNGFLLERLAQPLHDAGLRRITVSLDSLREEVFAKLNGRGYGPAKVLRGIRKAEEVGLSPIKLNCVVVRGTNDDELVDLARYFKGTGHIIRFIEFMDVGNLNGWKMDYVVPAREVVERISAVFPLEPAEPNYQGEVAERWRYVDGSGEIGVIASVTQPFCRDCTRARLSTDGKLVTCLFASTGRDLRGPMRSGVSDEEMESLIREVWTERTDRYSELRTALTDKSRKKVEMYYIGG